jgi:hypothetical protein
MNTNEYTPRSINQNTKLSVEDQLILARSKLWTPELDKLLRRWKRQVDARRRGHTEMSQTYGKRHYLFGVPAIIITTLTSTGTLTTSQGCQSDGNINTTSVKCKIDQWVLLCIGIVGLIGVGLTAIMTFMDYNKSAETNKKAADNYEALYGSIESLLILPGSIRGDPVITLKSIRDTYDNIVKESPTLSKKYQVDLSFEVVQSGKVADNVNIFSNFNTPRKNLDNSNRNINILKNVVDASLCEHRPEGEEKFPSEEDSSKNIKSEDNIQSVIYKSKEELSTDSIRKLENIIKNQNDFNSSDEEKEVHIAFDIDSMAALSNTPTALTMAKLSASRDQQIKMSLNRALQAEMERIEPTQYPKDPALPRQYASTALPRQYASTALPRQYASTAVLTQRPVVHFARNIKNLLVHNEKYLYKTQNQLLRRIYYIVKVSLNLNQVKHRSASFDRREIHIL